MHDASSALEDALGEYALGDAVVPRGAVVGSGLWQTVSPDSNRERAAARVAYSVPELAS